MCGVAMTTFHNPYISTNKGKKSVPAQPAADSCRLVPRCLRTPTAPGVIVVKSSAPPTYFYEGQECSVYPNDGRSSMWRRAKATSPNVSSPLETHMDVELQFHIYDLIETVYQKERCDDVPFRLQTDIIPCGIVLKLLGRTRDGHSVCVNVFGQRVYFYASAKPGVDVDSVVRQALSCGRFSRSTQCWFSVYRERKLYLGQYDPNEHDVFRISLSSPACMPAVAGKLTTAGCRVFETGVDAVRRFIIDNGLSAFGWYKCCKATPRIIARDAWTELEFDCAVNDLTLLSEDTSWPPYRVMSFDIECMGEHGFPTASRVEDTVIQISCVIWTTGTDNSYERMLLTLGTCEPIEGTRVYEFPSELDMFHAFFTLLRDGDVEIITGYNIANFDVPYVLERATQVYNMCAANFCRVHSGAVFEVQRVRDGHPGVARAMPKLRMGGLLAIDMYHICRDKLSLSDYKLNTVAEKCVGAVKDDVSYHEIPTLFRMGPRGRARIGKYCVHDSELVLQIMQYFAAHVEVCEIARLAHIPARRVVTDGQQIRVHSCLLAAARERNYILPAPHEGGGPSGYQGATVINPKAGFYNNPVLVVDFASLYPSIIQAHNLCYSTMILDEDLQHHTHLKPCDYETFNISSGLIHFVKSHICQSLLSNLLTTWLTKRKAVRQELAKCTNPQRRAILDKQQLAIKVTCNSVYGFTGVATGIMPCLKIAETVTLQGRTMLEKSRQFIEAFGVEDVSTLMKQQVVAAPTARLHVVYGDTDSLFVEFDGYDIDTVTQVGDTLAAATTRALFKDPIRLEAEKTFRCLLLLTKKRYVGVLSNDRVLMKGVELVRKTACTFVQERCRRVLELVLRDEDVRSAAQLLSRRPAQISFEKGLPLGFLKVLDVLNESYAELRNGCIPVENLTFSTELSRHISTYSTQNLPHLCVYRKMLERNEEPPQIHDRIQYVFTASAPSSRCSDMAEDPRYVRQHGVPIAAEYYFERLIRSTAGLLQCLFDNSADAAMGVLYNFVHGFFDIPRNMNRDAPPLPNTQHGTTNPCTKNFS
uniref:DNA polymerase n=2 Tax=unclassified Gammaherpesvirinae TaxID=35249 RepID=A0A889IW44_9GAMA|nr:DNA polymerase catalytic subunit [Otarine gammaherpesvirus 4]